MTLNNCQVASEARSTQPPGKNNAPPFCNPTAAEPRGAQTKQDPWLPGTWHLQGSAWPPAQRHQQLLIEEVVAGENLEELHERNMTLEQVWIEMPLLPMHWLTHSCPPSQEAGAAQLPPCQALQGTLQAAHRHGEQSEEHGHEIKGRMVPTVINRPKEQILVRSQGHPLLPLNGPENNIEEKESSKRQDLVPGANDRIFLGAGD